VEYDLSRLKGFDLSRLPSRPASMWRYAELLPADPAFAVSLGEGMTPLIEVPRLARRLGVPRLFVKDETRNPTWSFKDRLASSAVSAAKQMGARAVVGSSSGNAGSATAAFAARAGIPCVMFTTQQFPLAMRVQMSVYGTKMIATPTIYDRWRLVDACVDEWGWFPVTVFVYPLVGSNPYGIEGYKTVAFELVEQLGGVPSHVVMPVGAGDAFFGAWKGFKEFRELGIVDRLPNMIAAEVFRPLENALAKGLDDVEETESGPTPAISVGLNTSTYQALTVLRESGGVAKSPTAEAMLAMQRQLAEDEGIYAEVSSVISLCVAGELAAEGRFAGDDVVVAFLTSSGLKDPETTARELPAIPLIEPSLDALTHTLTEHYHFEPAAEVAPG
jgi:threonine synthase